jgi:hypothetical protein
MVVFRQYAMAVLAMPSIFTPQCGKSKNLRNSYPCAYKITKERFHERDTSTQIKIKNRAKK